MQLRRISRTDLLEDRSGIPLEGLLWDTMSCDELKSCTKTEILFVHQHCGRFYPCFLDYVHKIKHTLVSILILLQDVRTKQSDVSYQQFYQTV